MTIYNVQNDLMITNVYITFTNNARFIGDANSWIMGLKFPDLEQLHS